MPIATDTKALIKAWRQPRGQVARAALVMAWLAFFLNTALLTCCPAFAAASPIPHDQAASMVSAAAQSEHNCDETPPCPPAHNSPQPCSYLVSAGPQTANQAATLSAGHDPFGLIAFSAPSSLLHADIRSASGPQQYQIPPPKVPLYLRELRFLL